jgi:excisionase family DNA binding protein
VTEALVYRVEEVAELLGCGRSTVYDAIHRGEIPALRLGRRVLVSKVALDELLNGHRPADEGSEPR